jgi:peptidoglycan/LPS O-acetylase OafA/YrhL
MSRKLLSEMTNTRKAIVGLGCGLAIGVIVLGIGGRVVMSMIALLAHQQPGWTPGGTLEVLAFAALIGLPSGLFFGAVGHYLPGNDMLKGSVFGALVFVVVVLIPMEAKNAAFAFPELLPVTVTMFAALFVSYGMALALTIKQFSQSRRNRHASQ